MEPMDPKVSRSAGWAELRREVAAAGCFEYAPWRPTLALVANVAGALGCWALAAQAPLALGAPLFALGSVTWHRVGWLMHDAAHGACFGDRRDRWFAWACAGLLGEFPTGWSHGHDRHHAHPNTPPLDGDKSERWDPALRFSGPIAAIVNVFWLVRVRGLILPRLGFLLAIRDGIYARRVDPRRFRAELVVAVAGLLAQVGGLVAVFGVAGLPLYLLHAHVGMLYLNTVFAGNHYDLRRFSPEEAKQVGFVELQLRTTRNYGGGAATRWLCGGLENHVEHHLFTRMPRHRLRRAAPIVREWARRNGLPYHELSLAHSLRRAVAFHLDRPPADAPVVGR